MSILQQGDPQGQLCVADFCEEGVAVRKWMEGVARRRGWERTILYHTSQWRIRELMSFLRGAMLQIKMKLVYNRL